MLWVPVWQGVCQASWLHLLMLVYLYASICLIIQETGTHDGVGNWGIQKHSATFISLKKQTEGPYVAVFSILHKIKKDFYCAHGTAASLNEESAVEKIQRGNFTPAYEQGSE